MDKTKKQILLFIIIILIGICYAINQYIISPKKLLIQQKAKQIQIDKQKLNLLRSKSSEAVKLTAEVAKLKQVSASIGEVTATDIDTPQLIFDFYSSCKKYGIKGENLIFQLVNNTKSEEPTNKTDNITKSKATTDLLKLTIELKVSGDKNKVEKYIRSLSTLTSRKINVKSIKLEATLAQVVNNTVNTEGTANTPIIPNTILLPGSKTPVEPVTDQVTADIIFNQYIYNNSKNVINPSKYSFFNGNIGFSNFSDMFK